MKASVRLLGVITLLFEAGMLLALASPRMGMDGPLTKPAIVRLSVFFLTATFIAIGLFLLRKWAAVLFAVAAGAIAIWLIVGTALSVPLPYWIINFLFAFLLMLPTVVIIRTWSLLSWRGKWLL